MNKKSTFKDSLSVPIFETYNKSIFNLLNLNHMKIILMSFFLTLGKELENYFPPSDFRLKYRYKSKKSFYANISKDSSNEDLSSDFNKYITYNIIGMRLVVENVPDNFNINEDFIKSSKVKLQLLKNKLYSLEKHLHTSSASDLTNKINDKIEYINNKIKYLTECINFKKLLEKKSINSKKYRFNR